MKQHRQGEPFLVKGKNKEIVMTLREIAAAEVTLENIDRLPDMYKKNKKNEDPRKEPEIA